MTNSLMYTQRCTRARWELVALLRASLRYRIATPSRILRPRSTLAAHRLPLPTPGRAHPANFMFLVQSLYIVFPFTEHKKRRKREEIFAVAKINDSEWAIVTGRIETDCYPYRWNRLHSCLLYCIKSFSHDYALSRFHVDCHLIVSPSVAWQIAHSIMSEVPGSISVETKIFTLAFSLGKGRQLPESILAYRNS